jgi:hypothetical protein
MATRQLNDRRYAATQNARPIDAEPQALGRQLERSVKRLQPHETVLTGVSLLKRRWWLARPRVVHDEVSARIHWLTLEVLEQLASSPESGGWETLFRDPGDGRLWERTYPHSERHGGGPAQLLVVDPAFAERKYGWKFEKVSATATVMLSDVRQRLAVLIDATLANQISPDAAIDQLKDWESVGWSDPIVSDACHALTHFRDDVDIRARDLRYAEAQRKGLAEQAAKLRNGGPWTGND